MKQDDYSALVKLGRQYNPGAMFPCGRMTKADLKNRVTWAQRALDLKSTDENKSYKFYWAAWVSGCNPPEE